MFSIFGVEITKLNSKVKSIKRIKWLLGIACWLMLNTWVVEKISCQNTGDNDKKVVYMFKIQDQIAKPVWQVTKDAFDNADSLGADYILIHLNTYGGQVDIADSIRTKLLNSDKPVIVYIDNQAISAGALISIAADSIYMRPGGSIGAATVVNQSGEVVPDKYQSFMRSTMRATAEAHGKDTVVVGNDTSYVWHRNPEIAQSMVDPRISVEGVIDSGKVLTMTTEEAINAGYCEGKASSIKEVLGLAGLLDYELVEHKVEGVDKIVLFFLNPIVQSILILMIIGGIYFELQTPGIGFPLALAALGALLYFTPLYIEGLAENWELIIFVVGIGLLAVEIFVIPGFGIAGIAGIMLMLTGLTMSLIDNVVFEFQGLAAFDKIALLFARVLLTVIIGFIASIYFSKKVGTSNMFRKFALETVQDKNEGYVSVQLNKEECVGKIGVTHTVLRPSGRIMVDGKLMDAKAEFGYIDKGKEVKIIRCEAGQMYVVNA